MTPRTRIADWLFVGALMIYVLIGLEAVPFHADEFMQMAMARDVFYLSRGQFQSVRFSPPIQPDTEPYLRLLNGTLNKDLIGFTWLVSGRSDSALPGIFAWAMPLDWNREQGNVPTPEALNLARWPSALLTALSVAALFSLAMRFAGRPMAYPAAILYALHPVILLNGRRAMMEGGLLLFSILVIGVAVWISKRRLGSFRQDLPSFALLGLCAGLAVAAKHTGLIAAGGAFLGLLIAGPDRLRMIGRLVPAGVIALLVFFALNPAYWTDPVGALRATLDARTELLNRQASTDPATYTSFGQRIAATLGQPFLEPPQYYEAPTWNGLIDEPIHDYEDSAISGWRWPGWVGFTLTVLAGCGAVLLGWRAIYDPAARVLLGWLIVAFVASLTVPLGWQRYYLPEIPIFILLAAYVPYALRLRLKR